MKHMETVEVPERAEELETLWVYWKQHSDAAQAEVQRLSLVLEQQEDTIDKLLSLASKLTNAQQSIDVAQDYIKEVKLQRQTNQDYLILRELLRRLAEGEYKDLSVIKTALRFGDTYESSMSHLELESDKFRNPESEDAKKLHNKLTLYVREKLKCAAKPRQG